METAILLSTNALLSSAAALVMCVVLFTRKTYPGFGFWTAGVFCLAIGAAMLVPGALPSTWVVRVSRNAALLASLKALEAAHPQRLRALGFTDQVPALMACADLAITKPGGLSTSECLAMGLPMLLVSPIPGQEERNAALLLQEGVALRADDPATLQFRLDKLLGDRDLLSRMRARALALGRPQAACDLLRRIGP